MGILSPFEKCALFRLKNIYSMSKHVWPTLWSMKCTGASAYAHFYHHIKWAQVTDSSCNILSFFEYHWGAGPLTSQTTLGFFLPQTADHTWPHQSQWCMHIYAGLYVLCTAWRLRIFIESDIQYNFWQPLGNLNQVPLGPLNWSLYWPDP